MRNVACGVLAGALIVVGRVLGRIGRDPGPRWLGTCPCCFTSVFDDDPHMWRDGRPWHAEPCIEASPYAFRR